MIFSNGDKMALTVQNTAQNGTPEAFAEGFAESDSNARLRIDPKVLNLVHLARYTCGDVALEEELLGLFKDQAILQFENIEQALDKPAWDMALHTLKGSARGIGAEYVADLSAMLEKTGFDGVMAERQRLTSQLKHAVAVCIVTIETLQ